MGAVSGHDAMARIAEREARRLVESTGVEVESVSVSLICDGLFDCAVTARGRVDTVHVYLDVGSWEGAT